MSLLLHHSLDELIVVDNNPTSEHGKATAEFCAKHSQIKYVPMPEATGTTQPRERIFAEASGEFVLVLDCHVVFPSGAIDSLRRWVDRNPDCQDLLQGPLLMDSGAFCTQLSHALQPGIKSSSQSLVASLLAISGRDSRTDAAKPWLLCQAM